MKKGTVKFYNKQKGFGFIIEKGTGKEIFVHASGLLEESLQEDDEVEYEETAGKKGPNAVKVSII